MSAAVDAASPSAARRRAAVASAPARSGAAPGTAAACCRLSCSTPSMRRSSRSRELRARVGRMAATGPASTASLSQQGQHRLELVGGERGAAGDQIADRVGLAEPRRDLDRTGQQHDLRVDALRAQPLLEQRRITGGDAHARAAAAGLVPIPVLGHGQRQAAGAEARARAIRGSAGASRLLARPLPARPARCGRRCRGRRRRRRSGRGCRRRAPAAGRPAAIRHSRTGGRGFRASSGRTRPARRAPDRLRRPDFWMAMRRRSRTAVRAGGLMAASVSARRSGAGCWRLAARRHSRRRRARACGRRGRWW